MADIDNAGFAIEPESLEIKTVFCSVLKSNLLRHLSDGEVVQIKNRATEYINIVRNSVASMTNFGDF